MWDPVKREVRFVGQGHNEAEKMIVYSESDNSWKGISGPNSGGIGHGYDHNAINPATGIAAPIPDYDVIMFIKKDVLFLYKHKDQDPVSIRGRKRLSAPGPESMEGFISPGGLLPGFADWWSGYRDVSGRLSRFPAILLR